MTDKKEKKVELKEGEDPLIFSKNYTQYCKLIGIPPNAGVVKTLTEKSPDGSPITQVIFSEDDDNPNSSNSNHSYSQASIRAFTTALLGVGPNMKGGPYKLLKHLRVWKVKIGDEGVTAIAEILRIGGGDVKLQYVELLDAGLGPLGGRALGESLQAGFNQSLLTLKLDFNTNLGNRGVRDLCRGLRTNGQLKQLHLNYCNVCVDEKEDNDEEGKRGETKVFLDDNDDVRMGLDAVREISNVLANVRSGLEVLSLAGNRIGGKGLSVLCEGLRDNNVLKKLILADIRLDQGPNDLEALNKLADVLTQSNNGLTSLNLLYNRVGEAGGAILLGVREKNKNLSELLVDSSIPMNLFEKVFLRGGKKKGKKGKKKDT